MAKIVQISVGGFDDNFSYLILGEGKHSKEGVIIDPTGDAEAIEDEIKRYGAKIVLQAFTHLHPDHMELHGHFNSKGIKAFKPAPAPLGKREEIAAAGLKISAIHTPGHTMECVCFIIGDNVFSGDTLFVKGVGTTAYGGDDALLNETINFLFTLDPNLRFGLGTIMAGRFRRLARRSKTQTFGRTRKSLT